jgi:hypothetical protein
VSTKPVFLNKPPPPPAGQSGPPQYSFLVRARVAIVAAVRSTYYNYAVAGMLVLNLLSFALPNSRANPKYDVAVKGFDGFIFALFFLEVACKALLSPDVASFFSPMTLLNIVTCIISIAAAVLPSTSFAGNVLRVLLIARIARLIQLSKPLTRLVKSAVSVIFLFANVVVIILLFFYIYAVLGMNLFYNIRYGEYLTGDANFDSFPNSLILLLRSATGENFNEILHDLTIAPPYCSREAGNCGVSLTVASFYWTTFYGILAWFTFALFVAVVVEVHQAAHRGSRGPALTDIMQSMSAASSTSPFELSADVIERFSRLWAELDATGSYFLPQKDIEFIVSQMPKPLGTHSSRARFLSASERSLASSSPAVTGPAAPSDMDDLNSLSLAAARKVVKRLPLEPNAQGRFQFHAVLHETGSGPAH